MAKSTGLETGSQEHIDLIAELEAKIATGQKTKVSEAYGKTVEWDKAGQEFYGIYEGVELVDTVDKITGEARQVNAYRFTDRNGKAATVWGAYWIDKGMAKIDVGGFVHIKYEGQDDLEGAKRVGNFTISTL